MKKTEINIVKKMSEEQKKLLFFAPIAIVVLIILIYVLYNPTNKDQTKEITGEKISWDLPTDSKENLPQTELDVYDEYDKYEQKKLSDQSRDFFSAFENSLELDEEKVETQKLTAKDSMYLNIQEQLKALEENNKPQRTSSNALTNRNSPRYDNASVSVEVENNTLDVNDFFNKKVKTEGKEKEVVVQKQTDAVIHAVIHNDQKVNNNGRVKLRLIKAAIINDKIYEKNTFIYGFARFGNNRVNININNVEHEPVNLKAYDTQDGNLGLYVEGANDIGTVKREGSDDIVDDVDADDIPMGHTVKNLFKKKNKEVSVYLLNNYEVLLKTEL